MFKNKCPRCKSPNIVDEQWAYAMTPNICHDCGLEWEATVFFRLFLAIWLLVFALSVETGVPGRTFFLSDIGTIVVFGYLSLLIVAPTIGWFFEPYKVWDENVIKRRVVNYVSQAFLVIFAILASMYVYV